ncbi:MAG: hypothetical protein GF383_09975 [Candidatus Lokiarchaeota archaeon]|nr:hypothetical protein [Candidatus Lokiarchaeota archaeon]MBD3340862.1 hypothetical protein [Candidatus Lokiarchaeota archaeon]
MLTLISLIIIIAILAVVIILVILMYREYLKRKSIGTLLDKYVDEEKKGEMKEKMEQVSQIIAETENEIDKKVKHRVKIAKKEIKLKRKELDVIKKASLQYSTFTSDLKSAMPRTEEERQQDITELKSAMGMLESLDEDAYERVPQQKDAALGMFYDKMSRRLLNIIKKQNLNQFDFIPIQQLMFYAFKEIKNLKESDIIPILKIMKDTAILNDLIEINPTFYLIVFSEDELKLSLPEKVLLSLAYDYPDLNLQKLRELTEWSQNHADNIIQKLIERDIILIEDGIIKIPSFGSREEREKWNSSIQVKIEEEKAKQAAKLKKQQEIRRKLQERLEQVEKAEIVEENSIVRENTTASRKKIPKPKFGKKPAVKSLPGTEESPKGPIKPKKSQVSESQKIKDKDDLLGAMDALDNMMSSSDTQAELSEISKEDLKSLISEEILSYHEKFSLLNGGLSQYELIKNYIKSTLHDIPEETIKLVLKQLKELQMINSKISINDYRLYLFTELALSEREKEFIGFCINKKPLTKSEIIEGLNWTEEEVLNTMKELQSKSILRIEKDKIIIPGIIQRK